MAASKTLQASIIERMLGGEEEFNKFYITYLSSRKNDGRGLNRFDLFKQEIDPKNIEILKDYLFNENETLQSLAAKKYGISISKFNAIGLRTAIKLIFQNKEKLGF